MPRATLRFAECRRPGGRRADSGKWRQRVCARRTQRGRIVSEAEGIAVPAARLSTIRDGRPATTWPPGGVGACRSSGIGSGRRLPETVGGRSAGGRALPVRVLHRRLRRNLDQRRVRPRTGDGAGLQRAATGCRIQRSPKPGDEVTIAILAMNGPLAGPGGAVFVRYANAGVRVAGSRDTEFPNRNQ